MRTTEPELGTLREVAVIWNGNRDAAGVGAALHADMTSAPAHLDEPVLLKYLRLRIPTGREATHASLRSSLQRHRSEADA
jgi:hypothetical protein